MKRPNIINTPALFNSNFKISTKITFLLLFVVSLNTQAKAEAYSYDFDYFLDCTECSQPVANGDSSSSDSVAVTDPDSVTETNGLVIEMDEVDSRKASPQLFDLEVYPNPANEFLFIKKAGNFSNIRILSIDGKMLKHISIESELQKVSISDLPRGTYILQAISAKKQLISKRISII